MAVTISRASDRVLQTRDESGRVLQLDVDAARTLAEQWPKLKVWLANISRRMDMRSASLELPRSSGAWSTFGAEQLQALALSDSYAEMASALAAGTKIDSESATRSLLCALDDAVRGMEDVAPRGNELRLLRLPDEAWRRIVSRGERYEVSSSRPLATLRSADESSPPMSTLGALALPMRVASAPRGPAPAPLSAKAARDLLHRIADDPKERRASLLHASVAAAGQDAIAELLAKDTFRAENKDPNAYDYLPASIAASPKLWLAWARRDPGLSASFPILAEVAGLKPAALDALECEVQAAEICRFNNFHTLADLQRVLNDRRRDPNDPAPVISVITAHFDYNNGLGASLQAALANTSGCRIRYCEVSTVAEFIAAYKAERGPDTLIVSGHGNPSFIRFGGGEEGCLTIEDLPVLLAAGMATLPPPKTVLLSSCSVAQGGAEQVNPANLLSRIAPQATMLAATQPTGLVRVEWSGGVAVSAEFRYRTNEIPGYRLQQAHIGFSDDLAPQVAAALHETDPVPAVVRLMKAHASRSDASDWKVAIWNLLPASIADRVILTSTVTEDLSESVQLTFAERFLERATFADIVQWCHPPHAHWPRTMTAILQWVLTRPRSELLRSEALTEVVLICVVNGGCKELSEDLMRRLVAKGSPQGAVFAHFPPDNAEVKSRLFSFAAIASQFWPIEDTLW